MVDELQTKYYDVNLIYTGSYDSISSYELKRDPERKLVFELAKGVSKCLSDDFGVDRVYYPERDMLGGVNFFEEFDRVIDHSFVTLLFVSKDLSDNRWFKWLNHSVVKREKDKVGLNTLFLAAPGMTKEMIVNCHCEFMLTDHVIYVEKQPSSTEDIRNTKWYKKIKEAIRRMSGQATTNRQISEQAENLGAMSSRPVTSTQEFQSSRMVQSEEEITSSNEYEGASRHFNGTRGDISPTGARAERRNNEPNYRSPEAATDPPATGIHELVTATKEHKPGRTEPARRRTPPRTAAGDILQEPAAGDVLQEPAAGDVLQEPAAGDILQEPAAEDVLQEPAAGGILQEPAAGDVLQEPAAGDVLQEPAAGDVLQEPAAGDILQETAAEDIFHKPAAGGILHKPAAGGTSHQPKENTEWSSSWSLWLVGATVAAAVAFYVFRPSQ